MTFTPNQIRVASWAAIALVSWLLLSLLAPVLMPFLLAAVLAYALHPLVAYQGVVLPYMLTGEIEVAIVFGLATVGPAWPSRCCRW